MFEFIIGDEVIRCSAKDETRVKEYILKIMNDICGDSDNYTTTFNSQLFLNILEGLVLKDFIEHSNLEDNEFVILVLNLFEEEYRFIASYINNEQLGEGHSIALTLQ